MRSTPTVLHLDLDAFFASVEQRDKPSLRGRPVVVGGIGGRGVVATASYEARVHGVRSAMPTAEARSRCPHAAYLSPRFAAYKASSDQVMAELRTLSPLVEPLSLDEAFVDLAAAYPDLDVDAARDVAEGLRARVRTVTGGLTASVGVATSKLMAKIASELDKPDGVFVVPPGSERDLLAPMPASVIPGVGPATAARLRRLGAATVGDVAALPVTELVREVGRAHGEALHRLARADDERAVVAEREAKSVSVEDTFGTDVTDPALLAALADRMSARTVERLRASRLSGRTVTLKVRLHDFTTSTRAATLSGPTDSVRVVTTAGPAAAGRDRHVCRRPAARCRRLRPRRLDPGRPLRRRAARGDDADDAAAADPVVVDVEAADAVDRHGHRRGEWHPGADVVHETYGRGWVWGAGRGRVTVRFETASTPRGPVRSLAADDPLLAAADPEPAPTATADPPGPA